MPPDNNQTAQRSVHGNHIPSIGLVHTPYFLAGAPYTGYALRGATTPSLSLLSWWASPGFPCREARAPQSPHRTFPPLVRFPYSLVPRVHHLPIGEFGCVTLRYAAAGGVRRPKADVGVSIFAPAESPFWRLPGDEILRLAAAVGVQRPAAVAGVTVPAPVPTNYRIPRLPEGKIRRREIAVGERILRENHHRRACPAIARGYKRCRICKIDCSSAVIYREHLSGRRHISRLERKIADTLHFDICEITIRTKAQFDTHLGGRHHRKVILDQAHSADRAATLVTVAVNFGAI
jgi:Zinc-finger of C2H2 type